MSQLSISGAVSGVDTASIINSLVSVQQNQQKLLKTQQSTQQKAADAYASLISSLGNLGTLAKTVANTSAWKGTAATSSSTGVSVTATGNVTSSMSFDVTKVARSHAVVSSEAATSLSANVASGGEITVTKADGSLSTLPVGSGSLSEVVSAINGSSTGLSAAAVQTAPGQYRLQVQSKATGAASSFTLDGLDGFTSMNVLTQGSDAEVTVGSDPLTQYTVKSATNTFSSLVPGMSFTVSRVESGVTVKSDVDGTAVAADIQKLVDAANSVLGAVDSSTAYNATTKTGGPLVGASAARSLQQSILNLVSGAGAPGISLTRDGRLAFDETKFTTAYAKDPAAVAGKFGATTAFAPATDVTGTVSYGSATSATRAGTYAVSVSALAAREQWEVDTAGGLAPGQVVSLTRGTQTVSVTVGDTDTDADVVANLNSQLEANGFGVSAALGGRGIQLTADTPGSLRAFTATLDDVEQFQLAAGTDVQGTIDGQEATGVGNALSLASGTGGAVGLSVDVGGLTQNDLDYSGGEVGSVTYQPGLAQRLSRLVEQQTASGTGLLDSAKTSRLNQVTSLQKQIDDWDRRLESYRTMLTTQFTAMETAIAALKSQSSFLTSNSSASTSSSSSTSSG